MSSRSNNTNRKRAAKAYRQAHPHLTYAQALAAVIRAAQRPAAAPTAPVEPLVEFSGHDATHLADLEAEFDTLGGRDVELANAIDELRLRRDIANGTATVTFADADGTFDLGDGTGNPGCDCGMASAVVYIESDDAGALWLCAQQADMLGLAVPQTVRDAVTAWDAANND